MEIYKIITSSSISELEKEVNNYLKDYDPLGNPFIYYEDRRELHKHMRFAQAIIRKNI